MSKSTTGTCRLCQQIRELRLSHIISEFMHEEMYDEKHRFFGLSSVVIQKEEILQKGLRERLLCEDCEQRFGRHERYAKGIFFGGGTYNRQRVGSDIHLTGLQYAPLKLFFMSLLWRMGVTSVPALSGVQLGPHEERLRKLLLADDPGNHLAYPCLTTAVMMKGKHVPDLITYCGGGDMDGGLTWSFVAAGFLFTFFVSSRPPPIEIQPLFLTPAGELVIHVRELEKIPPLHEKMRATFEALEERAAIQAKQKNK